MTLSEPLRAFAEDLPTGWHLMSFEKMLAEPVRNGIYKAKEFHGTGARVVNMGEIFAHDFISDQEMKRVELTDDARSKFGLKDGDLLFARRSLVLEGSGKCSLVINQALIFQIKNLRRTRDLLLPRLLSGQLKINVT
jgi:type I restriction enzyme S subunit